MSTDPHQLSTLVKTRHVPLTRCATSLLNRRGFEIQKG
jgi:hypothetical protein